LYVVRQGNRYPVTDPRSFRKAGFDPAAVQVIPDAELAKIPLVKALAPGQQIVLDLENFLGAGHYMTTWGVLRKTDSGAHIDATTRTRTITMFGGFRGGVNIVYSDAQGFPVGMSAAADDPVRAAARVSVVSTIGYAAFLVGPPLLGFVGDEVGTLNALLVVAGRAMPVLEADCHGEAVSATGERQPFGLMFEALDSLQANEVYICTGSSALTPILNAAVGAVGPAMTSHSA